MISNQIHALVQWYPVLSPSAHAHLVSYLTPCTPQPGRCCLFSWLCCIACGNLSSLTRDQTCALGSRGWNPNHEPPGGSQVLCPLRTAHVLHTGRSCHHLAPYYGGTFTQQVCPSAHDAEATSHLLLCP